MQFPAFTGGHRRAARQRVLQRANDADVSGHTVSGIARAMGFILRQLTLLVFLQVRQGEIFKEQIEIFVFRNLKNKLILAFAVGAGLALTAASTASAALRALNAVILYEVIVTRVYAIAQAAAPLMKHRFVNIVRWDGDGLSALNIGYRALVYGLGDRLFYLRFIAAQKALPVDGAFIFPVQASVYEPGHMPSCTAFANLCPGHSGAEICWR